MAVESRYMSFLWLMLDLPTLPLFCAYLVMIGLSGVWQRLVPPATSLRPLLILHNFACCLASVISLCGFAYGNWESGSLYSRQTSVLLTNIFKLYWMTKVLELLDTVFMILRHKSRQISFLHVYHHSSMLLLSDLAYHYYPWPGIGVFLGMNSFVHIVLYLYYGLAALFPDSPPTWKRQMTQIQILQFLVGFVLASYGYVYHNYCMYSILYGITMTWLFSNFYYQAYVKKRPSKKAEVVHNGKAD
ncbi:very long chain fatty acid elongase 5-like [Littorina saxatilis]|uniref:Elongation of very long chain fatty acids protein n=1 Tax=Littorina saxatilis TaxID=31220 RepID=A0AAN9GL67_9CAEN